MDNLYPIFATPLMHRNVAEQIDPAEIALLINMQHDTEHHKENKNKNYFHKELDVLNKVLPSNSTIAQAIDDSIQYFIQQIYGEGTSRLFVTQSWLNFNPPGTSHSGHNHVNSILSGVLYLQVDDQTGDIKFYHPFMNYRSVRNTVTNHNQFTFEHYAFTPNHLDLFVFPSFVFHSVELNNSDKNRITLAFNTFYTGHIGYSDLSQLTIQPG